MTFFGNCERCGLPVTDHPAFPVVGWEVAREQGGANQIKNRVRVPDRVRHAACIPAAAINDAQEAML